MKRDKAPRQRMFFFVRMNETATQMELHLDV